MENKSIIFNIQTAVQRDAVIALADAFGIKANSIVRQTFSSKDRWLRLTPKSVRRGNTSTYLRPDKSFESFSEPIVFAITPPKLELPRVGEYVPITTPKNIQTKHTLIP